MGEHVDEQRINGDTIAAVSIERISNSGRESAGDVIAREDSYALFVDMNEVRGFNCLPRDIEELAVGHCYTLGLINTKHDLNEVKIDEEAHRIDVSVKKEIGERVLPKSDCSLTPDDIHELQKEFEQKCALCKAEGAVRCVAAADKNGIAFFAEDVARHNALDKVIGRIIMSEMDTSGLVFILSGRVNIEMMTRAVESGVGIVIASDAPTLAAVQLAEERGVTLLWLVDGENINIYSHPHRVETDK